MPPGGGLRLAGRKIILEVIKMDALLQDLRYSTRTLAKNVSFTGVVVSTLALGIGATSVLFSILDGADFHFGPTD